MTSVDALNGSDKPRSYYVFKANKGGQWTHGPELIVDMISGRKSVLDDDIQKELLDWILTDDKNVFRNKKTEQLIFALATKRGNRAYAAKKNEILNNILDAMADGEFDEEVPGLRGNRYRLTRIFLMTVTFSYKRYTPEQAWGFLRSTPLEDMNFEHGALNKLGANIRSIFGPNGKLTCKEADSKGYPAPHAIVILDKPVLVKKHNNRDGTVSWRLADERILRRVGKDTESRKLSRLDVKASILENPIWFHGTVDIKGIVKNDGFGKFSNGSTYVFKYLIKTVCIDKFPELAKISTIKESENKSLRTMMYTHLGNKCFRTRDIVFGKLFKERIGLIAEEKKELESEWERVKTIPAWEADRIQEQYLNQRSPEEILDDILELFFTDIGFCSSFLDYYTN